MSTEIQEAELVEPTQLMRRDSWSGAASRGLEARREREAIVKDLLREGHDFGTVPGCGDKPALLKPGAEKISDALNLYPDYEELDKIQDFVNRVWFYRYRCRLRQRGSDTVISTGIGSCNSEAAKYKYRDAQRTCPGCGAPAIIKGREEYGGGWLCFARKGGCGLKFNDDDRRIVEQQLGQVENPDIASLVNTVDKMAQKSSFVAACLNLGFSEQFTQDIDDNPHAFNSDKPEQKTDAPKPEVKPDVPNCPECGGQMWDNRTTKKGRQPDFKCKDRQCNKAVWLDSDSGAVARKQKIQAVSDAFKVLNQKGDTPLWTKSSANAFVAERFEGLDGVDALDDSQLDELLKILCDRIDGFKDSARSDTIASIKSNFKSDKELHIYLDERFKGKRLEEMTVSELKEVYDDVTIPF
jgi:hypothetical protein